MGRYRLTPAAEQDLEGVWRYTAETWGVEQAGHYIDDLDAAFAFLAGSPLICRERSEFSPPVRIHHHAHHLVVYLSADDGITVIRILHENMNVDGQLEK